MNDFKANNLPQTTWAKDNGINVSALRYWLKKLESSEVTCPDNPYTGFEFASVLIAGDLPSSSMILEIKDVKLSVKDDYDETLLLRIIKTLRKI